MRLYQLRTTSCRETRHTFLEHFPLTDATDREQKDRGTNLQQVASEACFAGVHQQEVLLQRNQEVLRRTEMFHLDLQGQRCSGPTHLDSANQTSHLILPAATLGRGSAQSERALFTSSCYDTPNRKSSFN